MFAELGLYLPLPICNGAITQAEPNAQNGPTAQREHAKIEMKLTGWLKQPAQQIKTNDQHMQNA